MSIQVNRGYREISTQSAYSNDHIKQVLSSLFCAPFCAPCASARLFGHATGKFDPNRCTGVEVLVRCGDVYENINYDENPPLGPGLSKKSLDIMVIAYACIWGGGAGLGASIGAPAHAAIQTTTFMPTISTMI